MRQVRVHGPDDVRVDDVTLPAPGSRDVVVDVAGCGICGTDLGYIRHGGVGGPGPEPLALGHEIAGTVAWVGSDSAGFAVGDRVVVHPGDDELGRIGNGTPEGGLAPELVVREAGGHQRLVRVPDSMSLEVAALTEPVNVAIHAVDQSAAQADESVAVFGCGPIGLAAIASLRDRGVDRVVGIDPSAARRDLAIRLGAEAAFDPDEDVWRELARLHGSARSMFGVSPATNVFVDAAGSGQVITEFIRRARTEARLAVVALHYDDIVTSFMLIMAKQLTIRGAVEYPARFAAGVELLARRDLSAMITHRVPLDDVATALALLAGDRSCGKVLITCGASP